MPFSALSRSDAFRAWGLMSGVYFSFGLSSKVKATDCEKAAAHKQILMPRHHRG